MGGVNRVLWISGPLRNRTGAWLWKTQGLPPAFMIAVTFSTDKRKTYRDHEIRAFQDGFRGSGAPIMTRAMAVAHAVQGTRETPLRACTLDRPGDGCASTDGVRKMLITRLSLMRRRR